MQINVTGHHIDLTDPLRDHVKSKLSRIERHFEHHSSVHVVLSIEKQDHKAEAEVHVAGGNIHAVSSHADMYAAIDGMVDKLDRQIVKHKEKITDHHRAEGGIKTRPV
jgi:putative sigma-54 modulation protein